MLLNVNLMKTTVLAVLVAIGALVQSGPVQASESGTLTVAGGCFWCVESDFESVKGVKEVISGFTGGSERDPSYKQVTSGKTGHFEAVQIIYDPQKVTRGQLLSLFFRSIDPTDAGGQFCDRGASYRSAVFVGTDAERNAAETAKANAERVLGQIVVTPILDADVFYEADAYHQDFYKGTKLILTRFGPKTKASAYKAYRKSCGRDARVRELWGADAPFAHD